ncbi:MAG: Gfo/Idh/MocA family oxidoreductase [Sedimentisphaerales bacterium]|nr:Gfo/Idh/MocA family oxidoreductase [Sedimentisphaerales bacterium]
MKIYKTAIIGCGNVASLFDQKGKTGVAFSHAGAYGLHPRTELVAACDTDAKRLKAFAEKWNVPKTYMDYKQMLREETIDILSVCTSPSTHPAIVREAAKAKLKAIYCEKPIAMEVADAKVMVKACKAKKILLMVNHQRRFSPFWREIKTKIEDGFFGEIQQVTCHYTRGIFNTGTHILDLFTFLFGPAVWTMAGLSKNKSPIPHDPNIDGIVRFKNGLTVHLQPCDDANYLIFEIDLLGAKGRLRVGQQVEYFKAVPAQNLLGKKELVAEKYPFESAYGPISLTYGVGHIINCLEKKEKPLSSGEDAAQSLQIIRAMLSSAQKRKPVVIGKKF